MTRVTYDGRFDDVEELRESMKFRGVDSNWLILRTNNRNWRRLVAQKH